MLLLVTKAHPTMLALRHPHLGRLAVPKDHARIAETAAAGIPWAADNGAFAGFDEPAFTRMLDQVAGVPGCRFVAAPDVVHQTPAGPLGDAVATLALFAVWAPRIRAYGLPVALVAQDGLERQAVPWDDLDALFVGASTVWKLSGHAEGLLAEAKRRGKWTHVGRVNGGRREGYLRAWGTVDSVDGSRYSRFTTAHLPAALDRLAGPVQLAMTAVRGDYD